MSSPKAESSTEPLPQSGHETSLAIRQTEAEAVLDAEDATTTEDKGKLREFARDVYDQMRHFVEVPHGLLNQVYRQGLIPKKAGKDGYIRMRGSRRYHRDERTHTPNGSIIVHDREVEEDLKKCEAMIHPPYNYVGEYRGEHGMKYLARTHLSDITQSAKKCGFCAIIRQGIYQMRDEWILEWAEHSWADTCKTGEEILSVYDDKPWLTLYESEIKGQKEIAEEKVSVVLSFPKQDSLLELRLQLSPWQPLVDAKPLRHESAPHPARQLIKLEFFSETGKPSPWSAFTSLTIPHVQVYRGDGLMRLVEWLNDCIQNHPACDAPRERKIPARLLQISDAISLDDELDLHIQLIDTESGKEYDYAALSHTWHLSRPIRTTQQNFEQCKKSIPAGLLSSCLYDAIFMTLNLGVEYIWIDSLCIIQDDHEDWEREAPRMGKIYENALFVIAAHGASLGLVRDEQESILDPFQPNDAPVYCRQSYEDLHRAFYAEPVNPSNWFGRSWCLQERLFARRIIHFGGMREECVFECCTGITCECGRTTGTRNNEEQSDKKTMKMHLAQKLPEDGPSSADELWRFYTRIVEDYTARGLTFAVDTLPAISSVMSSISFGEDEYLAGIWKYGLILSLQWEALHTKRSARSETYIAPSWSWASRSGAVMWYLEDKCVPSFAEGECDLATIVDVSCTRATADPYGKVSTGHLIIEGFVTKMEIKDFKMLEPDGRLEMVQEETNPCYVILDSMQDYEAVKRNPIVTCLDIMRDKGDGDATTKYVSGLVLLESDEARKYRRVGLSTMTEEHFLGAKQVQVTII